jgi:hypothetical protein
VGESEGVRRHHDGGGWSEGHERDGKGDKEGCLQELQEAELHQVRLCQLCKGVLLARGLHKPDAKGATGNISAYYGSWRCNVCMNEKRTSLPETKDMTADKLGETQIQMLRKMSDQICMLLRSHEEMAEKLAVIEGGKAKAKARKTLQSLQVGQEEGSRSSSVSGYHSRSPAAYAVARELRVVIQLAVEELEICMLLQQLAVQPNLNNRQKNGNSQNRGLDSRARRRWRQGTGKRER